MEAPDRLMDTMRFFNAALREDCTFCHVAGNFAADGNPRKAMARNMIHMTDRLAETVGKNRVTCYTCHHGDAVPKTLHPSFPHLTAY
jgi:photosynthetic reaction center cytochrome c subunit